ncbi:MAG: tRNA (5-methylaminomethyl-2-thiouridine)(34)-methyltransferase MnmD [Cyclobacteriaceae bacterium]|nr:tRNA (5-methylaminomethyl-2-thiouridine)(34)-methyltransferase MnmD [Cyclobacteriaceae bacterium]
MLQLINTSDGSHTIKNLELNETYHSTHGALQESNHVYIQQGLHYFINQFQPKSANILEVGFGTGLNALLTMIDKKANGIEIIYHTVEAFPLSDDMVKQLNYPDHLPQINAASSFLELHKAAWDEEVKLNANFALHKMLTDIRSLELKEDFYDVVYFDAFAPKIQPAMWTKSVLANVIRAMRKGGVMVTYCANGQFKRDLKDLGMLVEEVPGPPGKRVMVRTYRLRN